MRLALVSIIGSVYPTLNGGAEISFMSEYQYYEFRAIDKALDKDEMDELRSLSSRRDHPDRIRQ